MRIVWFGNNNINAILTTLEKKLCNYVKYCYYASLLFFWTCAKFLLTA